MKNIITIFVLLVLTLNLQSCANKGMALHGLKEVQKDTYLSQINTVRSQANKSLNETKKLLVEEEELSMAPLVVRIDFQKSMKVDQDVRVLAEDKTWWDLENGIWGFEDSINDADNKILEALDKKFKSVSILGKKTETLSKSTQSISFDVNMPDLNSKFPSKTVNFTPDNSNGYDSQDALKVTRLSLGDASGAVFFPFINLALHKQSATLSKMEDEKVINYVGSMNGYFILCNIDECVRTEMPKNQSISLSIPMAYSVIINSKETRQNVQRFSQALIGSLISEYTQTAFEKLAQ